MRIINIIGDNYFGSWSKHRIACRGIVVRGDQCLLSYDPMHDIYMLPGGGVEGQETPEACCSREIAEETGVLVTVGAHFLTMNEYYEEWRYESRFFVCEAVGETERKLTAREQEIGLVPRWFHIQEALSIFSGHQSYAQTDEEKRGIYLREYTALNEFVNQCYKG